MQNKNIWSTCRHVFSRKYLLQENIIFDEGVYSAEDCDFFVKTVLKARSCFAVSIPLFYYSISREGSLMFSKSEKTINSIYRVSVKWYRYFCERLGENESCSFLASRFANLYCDTLALAGGAPKAARMRLLKQMNKDVDIISCTMGYERKLMSGLIKIFGCEYGTVIIYKMYAANIYLKRRFWKKYSSEGRKKS